MFKPRYDELHSFLQWRRRTRFIRHHGGPIMALALFVTCLWFVWKALESRRPIYRTQMESREPPGNAVKPQEVDRSLQASKLSSR